MYIYARYTFVAPRIFHGVPVILPHMRRALGFCLSWYTPFLNNVGFMRKKEINKNAYVCDVQKLLHSTPRPLTPPINLMLFFGHQTLKA